MGNILSPFGDTNRIREVNKRKLNTDKCRVLSAEIRNQIQKYKMGNNWYYKKNLEGIWTAKWIINTQTKNPPGKCSKDYREY